LFCNHDTDLNHRSWDQDDGSDEGEEVDEQKQDIPTPSLLPCLSLLSTHLTHLIPSLPMINSNAVYRNIANNISTSIVDRVIIAGGSHRFSHNGADQFRQDVLQGWMSVISDVAASELTRMKGTSTTTALGQRPQAPWQYVLDVSLLLSLPAGQAFDEACNAAFENHNAWNTIRQKLHIDDRMDLRLVQEILRRRIDCPR
jgi:hypothetical protein